MIQRIQTVWWLVSAILLSTLLFLPLFSLEKGVFQTISCKALAVTIGVTLLLSAINIFLHKNRLLQIRVGYGLMFLHLLIYFFIGAHYHLDKGTQFLPWVALPLVSLIFQFLAIRGVKKDEALIKSMDRLR